MYENYKMHEKKTIFRGNINFKKIKRIQKHFLESQIYIYIYVFKLKKVQEDKKVTTIKNLN